MTKMHRKACSRSGRQVQRVTSAIEKFTPQLTEALEAALADDGWDVPAECLEGLQQALGRVLESRLETLRESADTRRQGVQEGRRVRRRRDEAAGEVYRLLVRLRHMVRGLGGVAAERAYFGTGKTPREPKPLALAASELQQRMRSDVTLRNLGRRFGGEAVLAQWAREMDAPLGRLFESLDRVRLLEVDETAAVDEVRKARAGMRRVQKNALKLLEAFYGLAERDDLADKLRVREPAARGTERSTSARPAPEVDTKPPDPDAAAPATRPSEALVAASQPPVPGEEPTEESADQFEVAACARLGAETAAIVPRELSSEPRAGGEDGSPVEVPPSPEGAETAPSPAPVHPVRKVLRWLSVVPHPVETAEDPTAAAAAREEAA